VGVILAASLVAGIPALCYVLFFRLLDVYEKEPLWVIWAAFLWGAVPSAVMAIIVQTVVSLTTSTADPGDLTLGQLMIIAPISEEILKAVFLAFFILVFRREIDSPLDGLVLGATVGLGFAATENVLYLLDAFGAEGTGGFVLVAFLRIVVLGFGHAIFTGLVGLGFSYARLGHGVTKVLGPLAGLVAGITTHAIWNGTVALGQSGGALLLVVMFHWSAVLAMFVFVAVVLRAERRWILTELGEEHRYGLVSAEEVRRTVSVPIRFGTEIGAVFTAGPGSLRAKARLYRDLSALALCKHNLRGRRDDPSGVAEIQTIRAQLAAARSRAAIT